MISLWVGGYSLRVSDGKRQGWDEEHEHEAVVGQCGCLHDWSVT